MTYFDVVIKKEGIHWKRMKTLMSEFKGIGKIFGLIIALILIIVHYAYMAMHSSFEFYLYLFNRPKFRGNLFKLKSGIIMLETKK
jgi:hypothetical protein